MLSKEDNKKIQRQVRREEWKEVSHLLGTKVNKSKKQYKRKKRNWDDEN